MNLVERAKNILLTPKTEWNVVETETATAGSLLTTYVLPMAILAALGPVIGFYAFGGGLYLGTKWMIMTVVISLITSLVSYFLTTIIVDMLAPSFNSEKNQGRSAQLVAYSNTPSYIASFLSFIPVIGWLLAFAGWGYSIYLMFLGIGPMKKTPEDKKVVYVLVAIVIMIAISLILAAILGGILLASAGIGAIRY